jgi:hypothetical protein
MSKTSSPLPMFLANRKVLTTFFLSCLFTFFHRPTGLAAYIHYCSLYFVFNFDTCSIHFVHHEHRYISTTAWTAPFLNSAFSIPLISSFPPIPFFQLLYTTQDIKVVMSPTMNTSIHNTSSHYTPSDAVDRHDYGVQKYRKPASTGGGRAWSEDEVSGSVRD